MREASKTNQYRDASFFSQYFGGSVLDIGAGEDLVCPHAKGFDMAEGDANHLDRYFPPESFDTVHSSHSLEHMLDPVFALRNWWSLVKPGGYLVLVVPDEDLYEQGIWPSVFSSDHKTTYRLDKPDSWSPVSYEVRGLCAALPDAEIVSAQVQSHNFDWALMFPKGLEVKRKYPRHVKLLMSVLKRLPVVSKSWVKKFKIHLIQYGYPLDQSTYDACVQIEVIVRKRAH